MVLVYACDGLFPLPVGGKAVSWTWCAIAMGFTPPACRGKGRIMDLVCACDGLSPCLSCKRPSHGLGVRSRWPLSPVCRRKIRFRAPRHPPERPRKVPQSGPMVAFLTTGRTHLPPRILPSVVFTTKHRKIQSRLQKQLIFHRVFDGLQKSTRFFVEDYSCFF